MAPSSGGRSPNVELSLMRFGGPRMSISSSWNPRFDAPPPGAWLRTPARGLAIAVPGAPAPAANAAAEGGGMAGTAGVSTGGASGLRWADAQGVSWQDSEGPAGTSSITVSARACRRRASQIAASTACRCWYACASAITSCDNHSRTILSTAEFNYSVRKREGINMWQR